MDDLELRIRKRAFPSKGRVRIHESRLGDLGIAEGDRADLVNADGERTVTVTVIGDRMVGEGEVRVSEEDLAALGLKDGGIVRVRKTPPLREKVGAAAKEANRSFSEGVKNLDSAVRKTGESVKAEAEKTAGTVKAGAEKAAGSAKEATRKAADAAGRAAAKTTDAVKKGLKGKDEL